MKHVIEIENKLLGTYLTNPDLFSGIEHLVFKEIFTRPVSKAIFISIKGFHDTNFIPDETLIYNKLKELKIPTADCSEAFNITFSSECSINPKLYVDILFSHYVATSTLPILFDVHSKLSTNTSDSLSVLESLKSHFNKIDLALNNAITSKSIYDVFDSAVERIMQAKSSESKVMGFPYGLSDLDLKTGGVQQGINVIAAMPGAGKTTQVINTIINNCVKGDNPMLFFSVEMPAVEIMTNIIANISEINSRALRMGDVDDGNILSINSVRGRLKDNFEIDDKGGITWQYIEAKIKAFKRKHNVQGRVLVAIDYLQLMGNSDDEKRLPKEERIETICNELTRICKDLNVHLILLSQFSREASKREGARPKMTDLKGSGAIEANAVSILLQWRPEYHGIFTDEQGNDLRGLCEINIAKGRYVNPEPVYVRFIGKYSKFDDYKKEDNSPAPF